MRQKLKLERPRFFRVARERVCLLSDNRLDAYREGAGSVTSTTERRSYNNSTQQSNTCTVS